MPFHLQSLLNGGIRNFMIYTCNICCPTWVKCRGKQQTFGESYIPDGVSLSKAHWHHAEQGCVDNCFNVGLANVGHHAGQLAMDRVRQQSVTRKNGLILKLCKSVAQPVHQFCRSCIHENFGQTHPQTYTHTHGQTHRQEQCLSWTTFIWRDVIRRRRDYVRFHYVILYVLLL